MGFEAMDRLARAGARIAFVDGVPAQVSPTPPEDPSAYRTAERPLREIVDDVLERTRRPGGAPVSADGASLRAGAVDVR